MGVARLRCFVWMLILALSAGLAAPAVASLSEASCPDLPVLTHVHADGSVHAHAAVRASASTGADVAVWSDKAPPHCSGCATAAECAVSCFGVAVLPTHVSMATHPLQQAWISDAFATPSGVAPLHDLDPPRPVSVH